MFISQFGYWVGGGVLPRDWYTTRLLATAWSLRVLCPCITDVNQDCLRQCMGSDLYALRLAVSRHASCGTMYVHPSALDASWNLKHGAPL